MIKILVCYVSPVDATADIAMTIAEQLCRHGLHVELRPVSRARDASDYSAVVLGGATDDGHWDDAALGYLRRCEGHGQRPVWLFHTQFSASRGPRSTPPDPVMRLAALLGTDPVATFRAVSRQPSIPLQTSRLDELREADNLRHWTAGIAARLRAPCGQRSAASGRRRCSRPEVRVPVDRVAGEQG